MLALLFQDPGGDVDVFGAQEAGGAAFVLGIRIGGTEDNAGDLGIDNGLRAGRSFALGRAGFESDVEGGAVELSGRALGEGGGFGVGSAGLAMVAFGEDAGAFHHDRTDGRVGAGGAEAFAGFGESEFHEADVSGFGIALRSG